MNNLGIPFNGDLEDSSDVVHVRAYTRADGTEVKAHFRSKSGHIGGGQNDLVSQNTYGKGTGGINGAIPNIILEERNGHYDLKTGKKVYYDGKSYFGNDNIMNDMTGSITGAAADVVNDVSQQEPLQGGVEYNDYSNIYEQLLRGTLPEFKDLKPTIDNLDKYYSPQIFSPHNDEAIIDEWAVPNLVMGTMGAYQAGKTALELTPYAKDIWAGKNLLFHKPFKWMSREELKNYGKLGEEYYKKFLQKNPVDIKKYGEVKFTRHNLGKDTTYNMEQYPFLRKNLKNAERGMNTNTKNEIDRNYDHFSNKYKNDLYHYIIENITDTQGKILRNYKMMKNKTKGE